MCWEASVAEMFAASEPVVSCTVESCYVAGLSGMQKSRWAMIGHTREKSTV